MKTFSTFKIFGTAKVSKGKILMKVWNYEPCKFCKKGFKKVEYSYKLVAFETIDLSIISSLNPNDKIEIFGYLEVKKYLIFNKVSFIATRIERIEPY